MGATGVENVGKKEANIVQCTRILVFRVLAIIVLITVLVVGSILIFDLLTKQEHETAENEYMQYKYLIEKSVNSNLAAGKSSNQGLAAIYSNACPTDKDWPVCYLEQAYLEHIASHIVTGIGVAFGVFIEPEEKTLIEDNFYARNPSLAGGTSDFGDGIFGYNRSLGGDFRYPIINGSFGLRLLAPVTQMTDCATYCKFLGLFDELSEIKRFRALSELRFQGSTGELQGYELTVLSEIVTFPEYILDPGNVNGTVLGPPTSLMFTSVLPSMSNRTYPRGFIFKPFAWTEILSGILPRSVDGIYARLHINSVAYHFDIRDSEAVFSHSIEPAAQSGIRIELFNGNSDYWVEVGMSDTFKDQYSSRTPLFAVLAFAAMILGITAVFFCYDYLVNKHILRKEIILQTKQLFVRYISHEIRTPLNTVCIGIGLVYDELKAALKKKHDVFTAEQIGMLTHWIDVVSSVSESSAAAVQVLNDLLDYEQIEISKLNMDISLFSPYECIDTIFRSFEYQMAAKEIKAVLSTDLSDSSLSVHNMSPVVMGSSTATLGSTSGSDCPDTPIDKTKVVVEGDVKKIEQVIRNFMSNAIKFTPRGGSIYVSASWIKKSEHVGKNAAFRPVKKSQEGYIQIRVTDSGIGLTEDQLNRLFAEGIQFDANRLQDGKGSGLGLMISKGIVLEHGGFIYAVSPGANKGCSFFFELPISVDMNYKLVEKSTETNKNNLSVPSDLKEPKRILLCDDSTSSVKLVKRLLTNAGYLVDVTYNGQECIDLLEHDNYHQDCDLVLIDNHMPHMTGPEAVAIIRQRKYDVRIVGLTGSVTKDELDDFLRAGCDHVLGKPLKVIELEEILLGII